MNNEQLQYVKDELARGVAPEQLKATLRQNNYSEELITQLFAASQAGAATPAPKKGLSGLQITLLIVGALVLVVVIPILLLGAVTMSSLNDARSKAQDAAISVNVNSFKAKAEVYASNNNSQYSGFCEAEVPATYNDTVIDCVDSPDTYRISAELSNGEYFCADSVGASRQYDAKPVATVCPGSTLVEPANADEIQEQASEIEEGDSILEDTERSALSNEEAADTNLQLSVGKIPVGASYQISLSDSVEPKQIPFQVETFIRSQTEHPGFTRG